MAGWFVVDTLDSAFQGQYLPTVQERTGDRGPLYFMIGYSEYITGIGHLRVRVCLPGASQCVTVYFCHKIVYR
jgi:hypothetical protein